jgi:hypothetical protein
VGQETLQSCACGSPITRQVFFVGATRLDRGRERGTGISRV